MLEQVASPNTTEIRQGLRDRLRLVDRLLAASESTVFDLSAYPLFVPSGDLTTPEGMPLSGVRFSADGEWISIDRLAESRPPTPPEELKPWLDIDQGNPEREPQLRREITAIVSAQQAGRLVAGGVANAAELVVVTRAASGDVAAEGAPAPQRQFRYRVRLRATGLPNVVNSFRSFLEGAWRGWAVQEAARRRVLRAYNLLLSAHQQISGGGEDGLEAFVGVGVARGRVGDQPVHVPLIEQPADLTISDQGVLSITPRMVPPVPALDPFLTLHVLGLAELARESGRELLEAWREPDRGFNPFRPESFRPVLAKLAAGLAPENNELLDGPLPAEAPDEKLWVSSTWCVGVRRRRADMRRKDIAALVERLAEPAAPVPEPALRLAIIGRSGRERHPGGFVPPIPAPGAAQPHGRARPGDQALPLFPLPSNAEQQEVTRLLDHDELALVVVEGPPGTGKTQTIANVISHSVAHGRRVLATAHNAEALRAIRERLPTPVRDLSVAMTDGEVEGARQLAKAVAMLADRARSTSIGEAKYRSGQLSARLEATDSRLREIDDELLRLARTNLTRVEWRGRKVLPGEIAASWAKFRHEHEWFPDRLDFVNANRPAFDDTAIAEARAIRARLGADIGYDESRLHKTGALPKLDDILAAHRRLCEERRRPSSLPRAQVPRANTERVNELLEWLQRLGAWRRSGAESSGILAAWRQLAGAAAERRPLDAKLTRLLEEAARLATACETQNLVSVDFDGLEESERIAEALQSLARGRAGFVVQSEALVGAIRRVRLAGARPRQRQEWQVVHSAYVWRNGARRFVGEWNANAAELGLSQLPAEPAAPYRELRDLGAHASELLQLASSVRRWANYLRQLFPVGLDVQATLVGPDVDGVVEALHAWLAEDAVTAAEARRSALTESARVWGGPFGEALADLAARLGDAEFDEAEITERWAGLVAECERLDRLRPDLVRLSAIAAAVRASGAAKWAVMIRSRAVADAAADDPVLPENWREAWDWAMASGLMRRIAEQASGARFAEEREELIAERERLVGELLAHRTDLGIKLALSPAVLSELRRFLAGIERAGQDSASAVLRQLRSAAETARQAAHAVPCWIVPEWRVAERLPAELGSFDLVIVDEASRANILALPVVLRGRKLLVLGDDRQPGPLARRAGQASIASLRQAADKADAPAEEIDPAVSVLELARAASGSGVIQMREHFRCVEPIIRFTDRFYRPPLLPLRVPKPSERLEPALVDILVRDGRQAEGQNESEARVVAEEVKAAVREGSGRPRSIGVVSLYSEAQARLIERMLLDELGAETYLHHRIVCGDPAALQGQERDIVFLSMVHDERSAGAEENGLWNQLYNVALSRARERLVLVRSLTPAVLPANDIRAAAIEHFRNARERQPPGDALGACQSPIEREVGEELVRSGYRLAAHVPVADFHLDLVVEGDGDRRLAIEVDGDGFDGPGEWTDRMRVQRALERLGWSVWRCWAADWVLDRDAQWRDLLKRLSGLDIAPIGPAPPAGPVAEFCLIAPAAGS